MPLALPAWVAVEETKPAPQPLLLVQAFVNTLDLDRGTDVLGELDGARQWFVLAGLFDPVAAPLTDADLVAVREVRASIRCLLMGNAGGDVPDDAALVPLSRAAQACEARIRLDAGGTVDITAAADDSGLPALWLRLLVVIRDAQRDGTWRRLKACASVQCGWVFYDRSHSHRGRWCDMAVCGNRVKNRSLRARQRGAPPSEQPGRLTSE